MEEPSRTRVRWTEHGPEEVEDHPPASTAWSGGSVAPPEDPVVDEPEDLATPEATPDGAVATPRRAARAEARRKRRVAAIEEEAAATEATEPATSDADDEESVRARLAARGMLRTEPSVRILDLEASPERPEPNADDTGSAGPPDFFDTILEDAEVLEPEPLGGPTTAVRCLSCRSTQQVSLQATGYRCSTCTRVWRWAACGSCDELDITLARQESWRCRSCGATTRSWWRTPDAPRHAIETANRRRLDATKKRRSQAVAAVRRQRTRLIAAAATAVLLVAVVLLVQRINAAPEQAEADRSADACAAFRDLDAALAQGTLPAALVRQRLDELARRAAEAEDPVRIGAERLAASGRPGDPTFEAAKALLARLCPP